MFAEDFLDKAHSELNKAAQIGALCSHANEARLLIGQALTMARASPAQRVIGHWPAEAVEKVRQARTHLHRSEFGPETDRASDLCDAATKLLEQTGKLNFDFNNRSIDWEKAVRSFGNTRIANGGRGHGTPLKKPLIKAQTRERQDKSAGRKDEKLNPDQERRPKRRRRERDLDRDM